MQIVNCPKQGLETKLNKISTVNTLTKLLQGICYIGGPLVIIFNFNAMYLFFAWLFSWIIVHVGVSMGLHRCFAHNSWQPKSKFVLVMIHFLSAINLAGPSIPWSATHRVHHRTADTEHDPHRIKGSTLWQKIKLWHNYVPYHEVSPKSVIDLIRDPYHRFFNKYYFHIVIGWALLLLLISPDLFMYGFLVSTMLCLHTVAWITVGAHIWGTKDNDTTDESRNTYTMGLYSWGEGWHNNHHAKPWSYAFGWKTGQPDFGKYFIEKLAEPSSLKGPNYYDK